MKYGLSLLTKVLATFFFLLFFAVVVLNHWAGDAYNWYSGGLKAGDLSQHYAGAQFWKKGDQEKLYRGYHLGDWITEWWKTLKKPPQWKTSEDSGSSLEKEKESKVERFNYVYSPFVVQIAACFASFPFHTWISFWFYFSWALFFLSFWVLKKSHPQFNFVTPLILILFFGFHSFYYTLIPSQNTMLTLLIILSSAWMLNEKKEILAGLIMSCAFYKPQLMPYFGLFMLICGHWKFLIALICGNLFWLGLGILCAGWEAHELWLQSLKDMADGKQFQRDGLNQSWRGMLLSLSSVLPENWAQRNVLDLLAHGLSLTLLIASAFMVKTVKRLPKTITWQPSYTLFIAATTWLLTSPYVGHYEILLGIGWWLIVLAHFNWNPWHTALLVLFWVIGFISILGLSLNICISAPFLTLWLFGSLAYFTDWQRFQKKPNN